MPKRYRRTDHRFEGCVVEGVRTRARTERALIAATGAGATAAPVLRAL